MQRQHFSSRSTRRSEYFEGKNFILRMHSEDLVTFFNNWLLIVLTTSSVFLILLLIYYWNLISGLPPLTPDSLWTTMRIFSGTQGTEYLFKMSRSLGAIYRINLPSPDIRIVVNDIKFVRLVLDGSEELGWRGAEKPSFIKVIDGPRNPRTMFTMKTYGTDHQIYRKAVAPSFSNMNLLKILPDMFITF
jgi:hypothetical protein